MLTGKRRYQLLYFTFFASTNGFVVFRNVYLEELGLSGQQMGLLGALLVVVGMAAQPIWGVLADRFGASRWILAIAAGCSGVAILSYPLAGQLSSTFAVLAVGTAVLAVVGAPIVPIANSMVLSAGHEFGHVRAFGSVAFGVGSLVLGWTLAHTATAVVFYVYAVGMIAVVLIVRGVPAAPDETDLVPDVGRRSLALLLDPRYAVLLVLAMLLGGVSAAGGAYFSVYVRAIGATDGLTGTALFLKTLAEAAVFLSVTRVRLPERSQLSIGAVVYVGTYLVYATVPLPAVILAVQLILGVGLALYTLAIVNFAHRFAPADLSSTAQALLFSLGVGTGRALGELSAGGLIDVVGVQSMYYFLAGCAALAFLVSLSFHGALGRRLGRDAGGGE